MRDDFLTADWADTQHRFAHDLHKLIRRTMAAFRRLAAIQYAAPWRTEVARGHAAR
jgi:hypothetical protein